MSEKHVTDYTTAAETKPFVLDCGHQIGSIHRNEDGAPFLQVMDGYGSFLRIYGYAEIECNCGAVGEWLPSRSGMLKVIEAWRKGRDAARRARGELNG